MITAIQGGIRLKIYVQPGGRKSELLGEFDGALKVRIAAPPVEGKANDEVIVFFAKLFGVAKRDVTLTKGQQSRNKTLEIQGVTQAEAERIISEHAPGKNQD